jgi:hypothetical protein
LKKKPFSPIISELYHNKNDFTVIIKIYKKVIKINKKRYNFSLKKNNKGERMKPYTPIYFLPALGAGGLAVTFFMYLTFLVPHPNVPLATFDAIYNFLTTSNNTIAKIGIFISILGILYFSFKHIQLLIKNIIAWNNYKNTEEFQKIKGTLKEVSFMAIPLTYAMSVNVMFVLGAVFVPKLWDIVEYLFPVAILAFLIIGIYALKIFGEYFFNLLINGNKEWENNNNLTHLLAIFAFSMIGVGFSAAGAMSHIKIINSIGMFFSYFFMSLVLILGLIKGILGFHAMIKEGLDTKAAPSLWIGIPIITLIGITIVRDVLGLVHHFTEEHIHAGSILFAITGFLFALEIAIGFFGYFVMKKLNYFQEYIYGDKKDVATYGVICPGVAFFVFGMFFIHWGLVYNHIIEKYSIYHFILISILALVQIYTIKIVFILNKKFGL